MTASLFAQDQRGALLSADGRYRYRLWRVWNDLEPVMVWVLLNPSTADAQTDDPTLRKCIGFAKQHHHGGVILVNLFAWRASSPDVLPTVEDPIGPDNDAAIDWACRSPVLATVIGGWGSFPFATRRATAVQTMIRCTRRRFGCFGVTGNGQPRHPLYLPYTTPLGWL